MSLFFPYGSTETEYLSARDPKLGEYIAKTGMIQRAVNPDLFEALVDSIVGQQISSKAHRTIMERIRQGLVRVTPQSIDACSEEQLQAYGISFRKAGYIKSTAGAVLSGALDMYSLPGLDDDEVCRRLVALPGIGVWTAEMLMLFSMLRPNILSHGDLAIRRGLCMLHRHREITPRLYQKYKRLYSPYCSVASLYLWALSAEVGSK